jgi:hypothetical protein
MINYEDTQYREWLRGLLSEGEVTVVFDKKDGTRREMRCTTSPDLIPPRVVESTETTEAPARRVNTDVIPVYDLELLAWRSFRWDSVREVILKL